MLVPSGTLWSAIATITNRLSPARSEANAVPIARPSGRLCTKRTAKTRIEVRSPARPVARSRASRRSTRLLATIRKAIPAASPAETSPVPPSCRAGRSRPTKEATVIIPTVPPSSSGRSRWPASGPSMNTGIAPTPVARAVAVAAIRSAAMSMNYTGRSPLGPPLGRLADARAEVDLDWDPGGRWAREGFVVGVLGEEWAQIPAGKLGGGPPERIAVEQERVAAPVGEVGAHELGQPARQQEPAQHGAERLGSEVSPGFGCDRLGSGDCLLGSESALLDGKRRRIACGEHIHTLDAAVLVCGDEAGGVLR